MKSIEAQGRLTSARTPPLDSAGKPPPLVAMPEVTWYLGNISRSKVYGLIATGELTRVRIGSRAFITGESITAFLTKVLTNGGAS
jgi:hypothetical protein